MWVMNSFNIVQCTFGQFLLLSNGAVQVSEAFSLKLLLYFVGMPILYIGFIYLSII